MLKKMGQWARFFTQQDNSDSGNAAQTTSPFYTELQQQISWLEKQKINLQNYLPALDKKISEQKQTLAYLQNSQDMNSPYQDLYITQPEAEINRKLSSEIDFNHTNLAAYKQCIESINTQIYLFQRISFGKPFTSTDYQTLENSFEIYHTMQCANLPLISRNDFFNRYQQYLLSLVKEQISTISAIDRNVEFNIELQKADQFLYPDIHPDLLYPDYNATDDQFWLKRAKL